MNVAAQGASVPRRTLARLVALSGWLVLAFAASDSRYPAAAQDRSSVILNLRGDETPETIRKMVDALSVPGRQVEIRVGGIPTAPVAAAPVEPTGKAQPAVPQPAPSMADEDGFQAEVNALVDRFTDGVAYGGASLPAIADLPGDWGRAWQRNLNGREGLSAGWRLFGIVCLALASAFAFRVATARWFARRMQPAGPEFTPRLGASSWGLLQDVATILLALLVARIARNAWLPESDLANIALTTGANGAAIGALYIAVGRFLLAPGVPERRLMPLPRTEVHFRRLVV
jgi:hypothetical protein